MNENEQWGNISLPGVSDEELFKKNWSKSATMKELHKNPEYKKKLINEESKKKISKTLKEFHADPANKDKLEQAQQKRYASMDWEKHREHNAHINSDPEVISKRKANHKQWQQSEEGRKAYMEGRKKICISIQDDEGTIWSSIKAAGQARFPHPTRPAYGPRKVQKLLKDPNSGWKKLS